MEPPELAVREGFPLPLNLPEGNFSFTLTQHDDGTFIVDQADPKVLISGEFLSVIDQGDCRPGIVLDRRHGTCRCEGGGEHHFSGALLKIHAANRNVLYRITEYVPAVNGYIGEWPE